MCYKTELLQAESFFKKIDSKVLFYVNIDNLKYFKQTGIEYLNNPVLSYF